MTGAVVKELRECPLPVIAAVNGIAAGAGSVIALASDFRLLAESASFAFLFTRVGLAGADMGSAYLLPRIVGLGRATELLILGDKIDAAAGVRDRARDARSSPTTELAATRRRPRRSVSPSGPAFAYSTTKSLLTRELDMDLGAAIELEAITQALMMQTDDFAEFYEPGPRAANRTGRDDEPARQPATTCRGRAASRTRSCAAGGDTVYLAGQIGGGETIAEQFGNAAANLLTRAAGRGRRRPRTSSPSRCSSPTSAPIRRRWPTSASSGESTSDATTRRWVCSASRSCSSPRRWSS